MFIDTNSCLIVTFLPASPTCVAFSWQCDYNRSLSKDFTTVKSISLSSIFLWWDVESAADWLSSDRQTDNQRILCYPVKTHLRANLKTNDISNPEVNVLKNSNRFSISPECRLISVTGKNRGIIQTDYLDKFICNFLRCEIKRCSYPIGYSKENSHFITNIWLIVYPMCSSAFLNFHVFMPGYRWVF